jgi:hypothetical protein
MSKACLMIDERRFDNYRRQNGTVRMTPRQRRRRQHKANSMAAPFGKRANR